MTKRRVVVTGMGLVCPIGNNVTSAWQAAVAGKSGVRKIERFDASQLNTQIAGQIEGLNIEDYLSVKELRRTDPFIHYAIAASTQAIQDANLIIDDALSTRAGIAYGSGIGGLSHIGRSGEVLRLEGPRRVSPFFIPASIINMAAGYISIQHNLKGPNFSIVTACSTGAHNIGFAARMIAYGEADIMVAGGSEMAVCDLGIAGFNAMRALSTRNDEPEKASRPWDKDRDGFVLGEGAGTLVLESLEHAEKRGAKIYAELTGFGMSGDAYHITSPDPNGAARAMQLALQDAKLQPQDIQYLNAHATSTLAGDESEVTAIKLAFDKHAYQLAVSSTKSMIGHLLGAAGAVEAIFSILSIQDQMVHPTINLDHPDEGCDLNFVPNKAQALNIQSAMSNSFGFGGTNVSLIFSKFNA